MTTGLSETGTPAPPQRAGEPVLRMVGVAKSFDGKPALRGASLHVGAGEVTGFVGPNGSGKTTCLRILDGLVFRDGGDVRVLGFDPAVDSLAIRRRCTYLPGETSLYLGMTGRQFLDFALGFYPRHQADVAARTTELFDLPLDGKVRGYSAGMKQKLALMATLIPDVDLYVLDEPDRALDATNRFHVRELLRDLNARGKAILLSSHHLAEVEALAHRLVFLVEGRTVDDERVRRARERLRREVRLRLVEGTELPPGAADVERQPDRSLRVRTRDEPLRWLAGIDPRRVVSAEVGVTRLERLYQILIDDAELPP